MVEDSAVGTAWKRVEADEVFTKVISRCKWSSEKDWQEQATPVGKGFAAVCISRYPPIFGEGLPDVGIELYNEEGYLSSRYYRLNALNRPTAWHWLGDNEWHELK